MLSIDFTEEFALDKQATTEVALLLQTCFPETQFNGRTFFKQLPSYRLLLRFNGRVVGHLGIDYRVMSLNGELIRVFGVKSLAVLPEYRGKGYGAKLMHEFVGIAESHTANIDFAFLVTEVPDFYTRFGFAATQLRISWLKIHHGKNYGVGHEAITDSTFMYKQVSGKKWNDGELDMLGYMY